MPGQVWFYYNSNATKELEKKKELGSCTSRPVVIIQAAFYPEWNDIVTVCPMTSSDRRSGVYIDSTVLKDGSMIEGGTVLPYLFYNIRTKYLFPMISSSHKRKLLSLSDEDFAKVKHGFYYHLGVTTEPPEYVEKWKHLMDYDRSVIVRDVKLAIDEYEDAFYGDHSGNYLPHHSNNPILIQTHKVCEMVENHAVATDTHFDHTTHQFASDAEIFNATRLGENIHKPTKSTEIKIEYTKMQTYAFANALSLLTGEYYPIQSEDPLYTANKPLDNMELKSILVQYSENELMGLLNAPLQDLIDLGINSKSTASRFRKSLRDMEWKCGHYDGEQNSFIFDQDSAPEPFIYTGDIPVNKNQVKKSLKRRKLLFSIPMEERHNLLLIPYHEIAEKYHINTTIARKLVDEIRNIEMEIEKARINGKSIPDEIQTLHEDIEEITPKDQPIDEPLPPIQKEIIPPIRPTYKYWETLCPSEANEIMHCRAKNYRALCTNFHITRGKAKSLKGQVANLVSGSFKQPCIASYVVLSEAVRKILIERSNDANLYEMLAFCQTDPGIILKAIPNSGNTPSKATIRNVKYQVRRLIVNDF